MRTRRRLKPMPRQRLRPPRSEPTPPAVPRQALCSRGATTGRSRQGAGPVEGRGGWIQGYNCQVAVDGDQQVIVAVGISNQASDSPHLLPMLEWIISNTRQLPHKLLADAGICSTDTIEVSRGLDRFLLRGTENTFGELNLIAITHNLTKLHRATLNPA